MSFARSDWSREYRQNPSSPAPDIHALYAALDRGEVSGATLARLSSMETVALARLREALFLIATKLERAESILKGEPVLGAPPVGRTR